MKLNCYFFHCDLFSHHIWDHTSFTLFISFTDHRSIVANTDWKKLWMETGQLINTRIDNNIDSSDSTMPEETEVN